eukprot:gene9694-biopygen7074
MKESAPVSNSVLQYKVRSSSPESGTELDSQIPVRIRSTDVESGVRYGTRFSEPSTESAPDSNSVLQYGMRTLIPVSGTQLDFTIPARSALRTQTPYSSAESAPDSNSVLCTPQLRT